MALSAEQTLQAAAALAAAWNNRQSLPTLPESLRPRTLDDAYAIQNALIRKIGAPLSGWKLGVTSAAAMERCGLSAPILGCLWDETTQSEDTAFSYSSFLTPMVEVEVGLRLARDLPPKEDGQPWTQDEVQAAVSSAHLCIELADCRYTDPGSRSWPELIADNSMTGGLAVGTKPITLADTPPGKVEVYHNDILIAEADHSEWPFSPVGALTHLVNSADVIRDYPRKGQIVATGSLIVPAALPSTGRLTVQCSNLGRVSADVL
ncbi:hypothetical protein K3555_22600 (plasmid) [Leisingera sp. M527]|uniref:2-keto-4-pentenoate hydratase n=1 Tax=Leisingera sp. M527 TaxID=2867014 RepID=UPI0021A3E51B|nr:hypothetical protein [Leisingera sp. M527]UWQ35452.1 hypothetical protein K3555_22600 [Leisingera sp. M527]